MQEDCEKKIPETTETISPRQESIDVRYRRALERKVRFGNGFHVPQGLYDSRLRTSIDLIREKAAEFGTRLFSPLSLQPLPLRNVKSASSMYVTLSVIIEKLCSGASGFQFSK